MRSSLTRFHALLALSLSFATGACDQLLGLGDFEDAPATTGSGGAGATSGGGGEASSAGGGGQSGTGGEAGQGGNTGSGGGAGQGGAGGSSGSQGGGGATGGSGGSGGAPPECLVPGDCAGEDSECQVRTCDGGVCGVAFEDLGVVVLDQLDGDCLVAVCDGLGGVTTQPDDLDPFDDGRACTQNVCNAGSALNPPEPAGVACNQDGGSLCDGFGVCVECLSGSDCASGVCQQAQCVSASCVDGVKNGGETAIDCGGACAPCADGLACTVAGDCISHVCNGTCQTATCMDNVQNGGESDVDCGNVCATKCLAGEGCVLDSDCVGGFCTGSQCAPTCTDGVKNSTETAVDCGGPGCPDCPDGSTCLVGSDCVNGVCIGNICKAPACNDGVKNGSETGLDCGGSCSPCAAGASCLVPGDCQSGVCTNGTCQNPVCNDGVENGSETDVDCGGPVCAKCGNGFGCLVGGDCTSSFCLANVCQSAQCNDGFKNGQETDVDCGGPVCNGCGTGKLCNVGTDCASGVCTAGTCKAPACNDGVRNGSETDVDCGGAPASGCPACTDGHACLVASDCTGAVCNGSVCCTPQALGITCTGLCGSVPNNCGQVVDCGGCLPPSTCGGLGIANVCGCPSPCPIWNLHFGDPNVQAATRAVADASGNVYVVGYFNGTLNFGGGNLVSAGSNDVFVAKYGSNGNHLWSKRFGDAGTQFGNAAAIDGSGNLVIGAQFTGALDFNPNTILMSAGGYDIAVAKFDPNGALLWAQRYGDASNQVLTDLAIDKNDNIALAGYFGGTVQFGVLSLTSAGGNDILVAKLKKDGTTLWAKSFGDASAQTAQSVDVDGSGDVFVAGEIAGSVTINGQTVTSAGGNDAFVAKLGSLLGTVLWAQRFGDASNQTAYGIATTSQGDIMLGGVYTGTIDLGGGTLTSAGGNDVFLGKIKGDGTFVTASSIGGAGSDWLRSVFIDKNDNLLISGDSTGTLDFGGGALTSAGNNDIFVAKYKANGNHIWSRLYGDSAQQLGVSVAADWSDNVLLAGSTQGTTDFGLGPIVGAGLADVFVVKFSP
jgi:hypothetical protein